MLTSVELLGIDSECYRVEKGPFSKCWNRQEGFLKDVRDELLQNIRFKDRVKFRRVTQLLRR